jgi:acetoin utilization deacetylase AcuC-like enzyme
VLTIASDAHRAHAPQGAVLDQGTPIAAPEVPERAERIVAEIRARALGPIQAPTAHGLDPVLRVHARDYVEFLETAYDEFVRVTGAAPGTELTAYARPVRGQPATRDTAVHPIAKIGWYSHDTDPIVAGTWAASIAAVDIALTGVDEIRAAGRGGVYSLCRPPGHHAAHDGLAGYCYLNNAAIAARALSDAGARVAILDVDFHHGNGTQAIFDRDPNVFFASLHADPVDDYPYFSGFASERGTAEGEGTTLNRPLPPGTEWSTYEAALADAHGAIRAFGCDTLVVSLGVDTALEDVDSFRLTGDDFHRLGAAIASLQRPTLFVQEGGYCLDVIGRNVVNVLTAFETSLAQ